MDALPARWYCDPATAALERTHVFDRGWHLLAHASRLRAPGDHVVADCGGLPVVAVRGADAAGTAADLRAFHNVCRHRAGPIALCDGLGARSLRCKYHGWTYGLDGQLKSAPEMQSAEGFDVAAVRLPRLAVREWQGLVFAAVDEAAAMPFEDLVAGIDARLGPARDLSTFAGHRHASYDIACNWKVYVDNFLEGYHLPHVHPELNRILDYRSYHTELAAWSALQWSPLESDPALYGNGDALYWWLWPNTMLNVLPGRLQTNRVVPLGVDRCRVEFDTYYAPGHDAGADADLAFSDEVQREDVAICEAVQRGLSSGSYASGPLNPLRETALAHFHARLREACER